METVKHVRRNSKDLGYKSGDRDTPIPAQSGRDAKMIRSIASLIRGKSKLLLLESPDMVEIYKLDKPVPGNEQMYLPAVTPKSSNLKSMRGSLTQSCPYLYDKRRGSFSSVGSQRAGNYTKKQSKLKAQREAKKSNVTMTMTYLGHGPRDPGPGGSLQDELKVLQQANGGENVCVFKGLVAPGEPFQFVSQRHRGFPFSVTMYVNGMMVARISSCCEYRYSPGFQQGKKSCFRLTWLAGGMPCYRCTALRNKYSSCQQLNNGTKENSSLQFEQNPGSGIVESCPSSPLFIPAKPEKKSARARRETKANKEGSGQSTDSEDPPASSGIKDTSKNPKRRKGQSTQKHSKGKSSEIHREGQDTNRTEYPPGSGVTAAGDSENKISAKQQPEQQKPSSKVKTTTQADHHRDISKTAKVPDSLQDHKEVLSKQNGEKNPDRGSNGQNRDGERLKDFFEECVEMSAALELGPNKHNRFKENILERCRLHKKLSKHPNATSSDVEASEESEEMPPEEEEEEPEEEEEEPVEEPDLQAQLDAMMTVLNMSDEVGELVLRNTDLTDDLLLTLATALKSSMSEVTLLNLNLNCVGPYGAIILLDLLRAKPHISGLLLFGNQMRDHGIQSLINGIAELQEQTRMAAMQQAMMLEQAMYQQPELMADPSAWGVAEVKMFALLELDIGGNGLSSDGLKVLASFIRDHSYLQYLGLAQTSAADLSAWKELFDSLKGNSSLTHIMLDQSNLGDPGVRLLADMLQVNGSLTQVDLDGNAISDVGGNDLMGALLCRAHFLPLRHLSLQENDISEGLMRRIQEEVKKY